MFALVIGIDIYQNAGRGDLRNLHGCINDTEDVMDYLRTQQWLSHVRVLRNQQATRTAILTALVDFERDNQIQRDDAILIYFAGHGTEVVAPSFWHAGNQRNFIQMLVPYDFDPLWDGDRSAGGITDALLNQMLSRIAQAKGDNIVSSTLLSV